MNDSTTNGRDGRQDDGRDREPGGERVDGPAALYARHVTRRAGQARDRVVIERVLAAIADEAAPRAAAAGPAAAPRRETASRTERSPEALYRRYRASRTAMPAATVDAIMAALHAENGARAPSSATTAERAPASRGAAASTSDPVSSPASSLTSGPASGPVSDPASPERPPSLAGRLFRLPGTVLDALGGALRGDDGSIRTRRVVPALALAVATVAIVPFLASRDAPTSGDDISLAVLAPEALLRTAERSAGYIDTLPASGAAFAGADISGVAYRLGQLVTDLAVATSVVPSPALDGVRENLRFVARASGDAGVGDAAESLAAATMSPPLTPADLSAPVERLREAVAAAADGTPTALRFALGQATESVALAARLAEEDGDGAPLREALAGLASVVHGAHGAEGASLPDRARASLDELVALAGQDELDARRAREVVVTTERLALLLG